MSALSQARNTIQMGQRAVIDELSIGVKATFKCYQGGIVCIDPASGYAKPGAASAGFVTVGMAEKTADNTSGADGAVVVPVRQGVFKFDNSASADLIAATNVGADCYVVDDHTVALTDALATRPRAGRIILVDSDGVWVQMGLDLAPGNAQPKMVWSPPMKLANIATGVIARMTAPWAGRILGIEFVTGTPATTGAKLATVTPAIAGTGTTGGAVALTSANATPLANKVVGSAVTALNTFTAGQELTLVASAVTTFVEGDGYFNVLLG